MKIECTVEELNELINTSKPLADKEKEELFDFINKKLATRY